MPENFGGMVALFNCPIGPGRLRKLKNNMVVYLGGVPHPTK